MKEGGIFKGIIVRSFYNKIAREENPAGISDLALLRRTLDFSDAEWIQSRLGSKKRWQLLRERKDTYFLVVGALANQVAKSRRELSATGAYSLEQLIAFDVRSRCLLWQLRISGVLVFAGVPVRHSIDRCVQSLVAMLPAPASASPARF
jgi:hypothetical protein